jgi:SAM-dependent methyltransferase
MKNQDESVVEAFGEEWSRFDQSGISDGETQRLFDCYFRRFPWDRLPKDAVGADFGCGSGRWARLVAGRVGRLVCLDASVAALEVAKRNLRGFSNVEFHASTIDSASIAPQSLDFGYSLGVLHHIPDTQQALNSCVQRLRPGAPFLCYLYFRFDNRPWWYRALWRMTEPMRFIVSRSPARLRHALADLLALLVYWPVAAVAKLAERMSVNVDRWPLAFYRNQPFYVLRTDALDRFGTRLEQRFTRTEIVDMATRAGLVDVTFNETSPFWCFLAYRK